MANVIIKTDERRKSEAYVLEKFGHSSGTTDRATREHAECIAAKTREAYEKLKKMEG